MRRGGRPDSYSTLHSHASLDLRINPARIEAVIFCPHLSARLSVQRVSPRVPDSGRGEGLLAGFRPFSIVPPVDFGAVYLAASCWAALDVD